MESPQARSPREPGRGLVALALVLLVAFGTWTRIRTTLADPGFASAPAAGLLRSDPALLAYFTQRIAESGGVPADFSAEPRIEHPLELDVPALFPIGPEFLVAALWRILGPGTPLHLACLYASSFVASLLVLGVYLLARELSGRRTLGLAAALFAALLPANYRTIGFLFVGEDWSMPLFMLHLGLAARPRRQPGIASAVLCAVPLVGALATWHAASFFLTLEALAFFAWFWIRGRNPFACAPAWCVVGLLALGGVAVPVLRHTGFVFSLPMQIAGALGLAGLAARRGWGRPAAVGALAVFVACGSIGSSGEYSHVFGLVWHKLVQFGSLPDDPLALPPEVRLMWQGPFATLSPTLGVALLGLGALGFVFAGIKLVRRTQDEPLGIACLLALGSLPLAWLVERTLVLPALLAAPLCAAACVRWRASWIGGALLAQALLFAHYLSGYVIPWYQPPLRQQELAAVLRALPGFVPEGEAVATDFVNGTAVLLQTRRPILLQPKWESRQSRERIERFLEAFFHGTLPSFSRMLREDFRCHYLLVDRAVLGLECRYAAGIPARTEPPPDSPAALLCVEDAARLSALPGCKLLYRSPKDIYRLFELGPEAR